MGSEAEEEIVKQLKELRSALNEENYESVIPLAQSIPSLLTVAYDDDDEVIQKKLLPSLTEIHAKALLQQDQFDAALALAQQRTSTSSQLLAVHAYALYRQNNFSAAKNQCLDSISKKEEDSDDQSIKRALNHILAQSLYNLQETDKALEIYCQQLSWLDRDNGDDSLSEERLDMYTNLTAVLLSQATPYGGLGSDGTEETNAAWQNVLNKINAAVLKNQEMPYDLLYNVATLNLMTGTASKSRWLSVLQQAEQQCLDQNSSNGNDSDNGEFIKEITPIRMNLQWSRAFWAGSLPSQAGMSLDDNKAVTKQSSVADPLRALQQVHAALAAAATTATGNNNNKYPEEPHPKWTPAQQRMWFYNKAIFQLRTGQPEECLQTCQSLWTALQPPSTNHNKKKKKQAQQALSKALVNLEVNSPSALLWWETRITVLRAYCCGVDEKQQKECLSGLEALKTKIQGMSESSVRDQALCYVQLHLQHLMEKKDSSVVAGLNPDLLPPSIQTKPAVLATLAAQYKDDPVKANEYLKATGDPQALANFAMAQGDYSQAAALYEQQVQINRTPATVALWVQALSHVDPDRARNEWSKLRAAERIITENQDVDLGSLGAQLEARELPRISSRTTKPGLVTSTTGLPLDSTTTSKGKKSHEAVLRRRARKREVYLQTHDASRPPDPERWLPKYERSSNARRRRKQQQQKRSAQGVQETVKEKSTSTSTAHMPAVGGAESRKGGRRR